MADVDTGAVTDLFEQWSRELAQVDHEPDAALVASLEAQALELGVNLLDVLGEMQSLTAAFNESLHPRGKDGQFIEVGGLIKLFNFKLKGKDGKDHDYSGQRGKVLGITPDKKSDKLPPDIRVGLGPDPNKPSVIVTVKPDHVEAAPEKARLDTPDSYKAPDVKMPSTAVKEVSTFGNVPKLTEPIETPSFGPTESYDVRAAKMSDAGAVYNRSKGGQNEWWDLPDGSGIEIADSKKSGTSQYTVIPPGGSPLDLGNKKYGSLDEALANTGGVNDRAPGMDPAPAMTPTPPKSENQKLNDAGAKWNSNLQQYELPDGSKMAIDNVNNKPRYSVWPPGVSRWSTDQSSVTRHDNIDDALSSIGGDDTNIDVNAEEQSLTDNADLPDTGIDVPLEEQALADAPDTGFVDPADRTPDEIAEDDDAASLAVSDLAENLIDSGIFDDWYGREGELHEGKLWLAP